MPSYHRTITKTKTSYLSGLFNITYTRLESRSANTKADALSKPAFSTSWSSLDLFGDRLHLLSWGRFGTDRSRQAFEDKVRDSEEASAEGDDEATVASEQEQEQEPKQELLKVMLGPWALSLEPYSWSKTTSTERIELLDDRKSVKPTDQAEGAAAVKRTG